MKRECDEFTGDLSALIDGALPAERRAQVEAHVAGCADCRQRVAELRRLAEGVAALPKLEPAPQFLADVRRKIRGDERVSWVDALFRPFWIKMPLEAAVLAVIVVTTLMLTRPVPPVKRTQSNFAEADQPAAPASVVAKQSESSAVTEPRLELPLKPQPVAPAAAPAEARADEEKLALGESRNAYVKREAVAVLDKSQPASDRLMNNVLMVTNNTTLLYARPSESIVVHETDVAAVRARIDSLARPLSGRVIAEDNRVKDATKLYVALPVDKVAAFKAQLETAQVLSAERRRDLAAKSWAVGGEAGMAQTPGEKVVVLQRAPQAAAAPVVTGAVAQRQKEAEPTTVLEIVVQPGP